MRRGRQRVPRRDERGQATVLIIGFALIIAMIVAVVIDSTAAYVQRQGLDSLADGAALRGADLGATGTEVYADGVPVEGQLQLTGSQARAAVAAYLAAVGAGSRYPGLSWQVQVDATRVTVRLDAPLDLPLSFPGAPVGPRVGSTGSAAVDPDG